MTAIANLAAQQLNKIFNMTRDELADAVCHNPSQRHWYLRRIDEYTESVIATTRRETVEEIYGRLNYVLDNIKISSNVTLMNDEETVLYWCEDEVADLFDSILDQLPDKQEGEVEG